jgi:photosystem II PsbY protein
MIANHCNPAARRDGKAPVVLKITPSFPDFTMDLRLVLVAAPIVLAASWAVFHIGRAAVGQLQMFINRGRAA